MKSEEMAGNLVALLTVMLWGVTFVSTRILLESFTPSEILVLRFALGYAALCLVPSPRIGLTTPKEESLFAMGGLTGVTLYFLFENIALLHTLVSNVGVIVSSAPFFTALLACLCLNAPKLRFNYYLGFLLAMAGIVLISKHGAAMEFNLAGDSLALMAALSWAVYSVIIRKLACRGYNSLSVTRRIFFYGLLFMLPLLFMDNFRISLEELLLPLNLANILFLGLGASALCFATWTFALKRLGAARASLYIYLVPVVTIISSALILEEMPGFYTIIGAVLTILGLLISEQAFDKGKTSSQRGSSQK